MLQIGMLAIVVGAMFVILAGCSSSDVAVDVGDGGPASDGRAPTAETGPDSDAGTLAPPNHAPTPAGDAVTTPAGQPVTFAVLPNDTDPDGDTLAIIEVSQPAHGMAKSNYGGTLTYTPDAGYVGMDSFTYTVVDGTGARAQATVTVTVTQ